MAGADPAAVFPVPVCSWWTACARHPAEHRARSDRATGSRLRQWAGTRAIGPLAHGEVQKASEEHRRLFAGQVVVLIIVKDEGGRLDVIFRNRPVPVLQYLVMLVANEVHGPTGPLKDFIEASDGVVE